MGRISAAVFTEVYVIFFKPQVLDLLLFLSITLGSVSLFGTVFLQSLPAVSKEPLLAQEEKKTGEGTIQSKQHFSYLKMMKTLDFWLLFTIFGAVAGAGFVIFNNLGNVVLSLVKTVQ